MEDGEILGVGHLVFHVGRGVSKLLFERVDLTLLVGQTEGDGLCLEEEEGGADGEEGDGSVVEEAVDAPW